MTEEFQFDEVQMLLHEKAAVKAEREKFFTEEQLLQAKLEEIRNKRFALSTKDRSIDDRIFQAKEKIRKWELEQKERAAEEERKTFLSAMAEEIMAIIAAHEFESLAKAHDYQKDDIFATIQAFNEGKPGMLNANDMGLGKTYEAAVTLFLMTHLFEKKHERKPKILWLTKKSLLPGVNDSNTGTPKEIKRWWPGCKIITPVTSMQSNKEQREFLLTIYDNHGDIFLANYEFIRTTPGSSKRKWDIVVVDECHKLKGGANANGPTAIFTAVKEVLQNSEFMMMLSGTPMVNKAEEMWSYLHCFAPDRFPTLKQFRRDFMQYKDFAGEFQLCVDPNKILNQALKGMMIRRSRDEVGLQLPSIVGYENEEFVELDMSPLQQEAYSQMRRNFFVWLDGQEKPLTAAAIIAQLTRLRQIAVWPSGIKFKELDSEGNVIKIHELNINESAKIDQAVDIISQTDDQVVVFCTFNEPLNEIKRRCDAVGLSCEIISGEGKISSGELEKKFQQGELQVLCINSAMGEGLNLQKNPSEWPGGSATGILLDRWWSPARNDQCVARLQRQGSDGVVFIHNLFSVKSVDYFIQDMIEMKRASFADIMDSDHIRPAGDWKNYLEGKI